MRAGESDDCGPAADRPALWGGPEYTIVRRHDTYRSQVEETGHAVRDDDIAALAALGLRRVRYPVLWEAIEPEAPGRSDWRFTDARLARLRAHGIQPIAGLLHHGSGPRYTSLLDPDFPDLFAAYARRVAERYPWITHYTLINEPLTTARFSALYGHWYPHTRDNALFLRAVVLQSLAIAQAARAVRAVTPGAVFIQTEDLGKTFSTPALVDQARYENERRWLSYDLLFGQVDAHHPLHDELTRHGVEDRALGQLLEGDGAPDIVGINHYLTSERFLDERIDLYPPATHGGNGRQTYADLEAIRMDLPPEALGFAARLREAEQRYGRPLAVTELHHGCSRDEQLRWLAQGWREACRLRAQGMDLRAVTAWALFGTVDWSSLLVAEIGHYEPGAYDVRAPAPRLTAIGRAVQSIARTGAVEHPVLAVPGWWQRPERFYRGQRRPWRAPRAARPLLLVESGLLGEALERTCRWRGLATTTLAEADRRALYQDHFEALLRRSGAWAVVDTRWGAGGACDAPLQAGLALASAARALGLPTLVFSCDLVFAPRPDACFEETDDPDSDTPEGVERAQFERSLMRTAPGTLIARSGPVFAPWTPPDAEAAAFDALGPDVAVSPTYLPDLAHAALDLLLDGEFGLWHLANGGAVTPADFLARIGARPAGPDGPDAPRATRGLTSRRGWPMPTLDSALSRLAGDRRSALCVLPAQAAAE